MECLKIGDAHPNIGNSKHCKGKLIIDYSLVVSTSSLQKIELSVGFLAQNHQRNFKETEVSFPKISKTPALKPQNIQQKSCLNEQKRFSRASKFDKIMNILDEDFIRCLSSHRCLKHSRARNMFQHVSTCFNPSHNVRPPATIAFSWCK